MAKKLTALLLALCMIVGLAACGSSSSDTASPVSSGWAKRAPPW